MEAASRGLQIRWYPARYHAGLGSIFAMGDILECCKSDTLDVCILEEPEHWYVIVCRFVLWLERPFGRSIIALPA
jgi:hypothetical protein